MKRYCILFLLSCSTSERPQELGNSASQPPLVGAPATPTQTPKCPLSISKADAGGVPCSLDPCDPYCNGYNEVPDASITIGTCPTTSKPVPLEGQGPAYTGSDGPACNSDSDCYQYLSQVRPPDYYSGKYDEVFCNTQDMIDLVNIADSNGWSWGNPNTIGTCVWWECAKNWYNPPSTSGWPTWLTQGKSPYWCDPYEPSGYCTSNCPTSGDAGTTSNLPYSQTYIADCPTGTIGNWHWLTYCVTVPSTATVSINVQVTDTLGTWATATTVVTVPSDPQLCVMTGQTNCPKNIQVFKGKYLQLTFNTTYNNCNPTDNVSLNYWAVTYDCTASE